MWFTVVCVNYGYGWQYKNMIIDKTCSFFEAFENKRDSHCDKFDKNLKVLQFLNEDCIDVKIVT